MRLSSTAKSIVMTGFLLILALPASACSNFEQKGDKPSADWSRSAVLGENAVGSIGMALEESEDMSGDRVHLVWPYEKDGKQRIRYLQLDQRAQPVLEQAIDHPGQFRSPRLVPAGPDHLHLFWASRLRGGENWSLWHLLLSTKGEVVGEAKRVPNGDDNVGQFMVGSDGLAGAIVTWDRGAPGEIQILHLNPNGESISGPTAIASHGESPSMHVHTAGQVHLAWLADRSFYYGSAPIADLDHFQPTEVVDLRQRGTLNTSGDSLEGPVLGFADGWVYLFWTVVSLSDTEAGQGVAEFVAFPDVSPEISQPERLWAIPAEDQPYVEQQTAFSLTQLSQPRHIAQAAEEFGVREEFYSELAGDWTDVAGAVSDYILSPAAMIGEGHELAVALAIGQDYGTDQHLQIATALFSEGQYLGYGFAGKTPYLSDDPVLAVDSEGNLHVSWREGAKGEGIYYATTAPEAKAALDRLEAGDLVFAAPQGVTDMMASLAFIPFIGFCWILPGLFLIGGWQLIRDEDSLDKRATWIPLIIALLLYYGAKFVFLPTFTTYVPFSAWIYIPSALAVLLRLAIPTVILALSALAAFRVHKNRSNSTLVFFLAWVLTDGLLTLAIYGVNLLGTF